jgi:hypothetical protein
MSTLEGKPGERHLFRVDTEAETEPVCISCDLGSECLFNHAYFSNDATYYALDCLGPGVPKVTIKSTQLERSDLGEQNLKYVISIGLTIGFVTLAFLTEHVIQDNDQIQQELSVKSLPKIKTLSVPVDGGYSKICFPFLRLTYKMSL